MRRAFASVLVTGASGFVGSAVVARLYREDRFAVGAAVRQGALRAFPEGVALHPGLDLSVTTDWTSALSGVDCVVHAAARVHVMHDAAADLLAEFRRINVAGTLNLASQAARLGVRRFIFLSSIKVNGERTDLGSPFRSDDLPAPVDAYGISKREAEDALRRLASETGMEVVIIRPPLVYGSGVKANFLSMMRWLNRGVPLPFGAIQNKRSLVALDNLVDLIVTCIDHPAAANQTFLVSDGEDLSTTELLRRMAVALDMPARLLPVPQKLLEMGFKIAGKSDLAQRLCGSLQVDITKACTILDWEPLIPVDEGLHRTAEYFLRSRG